MGVDKFLSMEDIISMVTGLLKEEGYRFCVAGGWAVGIWGAVRATEDIDLVVVTGDDGVRALVDGCMTWGLPDI